MDIVIVSSSNSISEDMRTLLLASTEFNHPIIIIDDISEVSELVPDYLKEIQLPLFDDIVAFQIKDLKYFDIFNFNYFISYETPDISPCEYIPRVYKKTIVLYTMSMGRHVFKEHVSHHRSKSIQKQGGGNYLPLVVFIFFYHKCFMYILPIQD